MNNLCKEASYYESVGNNVKCLLCPHHCLISEGKSGRCLGRVNHNGILYAENYGKVTSLAVDPMTKKPFNRFYSDNTILTVASYGCNLACRFCQNHHISQCKADYTEYTPQEILNLALHHTVNDNVGLAFSYNEPTVSFEFVRDCFRLVKNAGMQCLLVTNGYLEEKPFQELSDMTDAMNIDLKGFREEFYKDFCHGDLETVKRNIRLAAEKCHVEITTLLIPNGNDSKEEIEAMAKWIAAIDPNIPYHISRFFPRYQMEGTAPTPIDTMEDAAEIASQYLRYVYLGNM